MRYERAFDDEGNYLMTAAQAPLSARAAFVRNTYAHVGGAVLAFVGLEALLFATGAAEAILSKIFASGGRLAWIALMVAFVGGGYVANMLAHSRSRTTQYLGLAGYVVLEALIFLPILYLAEARFPNQYLAAQAGLITLAVFGALTTFVFISGANFSFLGPIITIASFAALGLVICSVIFGFSLGLVFSAAMVALAGAAIVYQTSNIIHEYPTDHYVGAALALFASIATMFYYILRILIASRSE